MGQKGSKIKITEQDKAVLQLKRSKDSIHRYTRRTNDLIASEQQELKAMIRANPQTYKSNNKVRLLLKRVHYQERLLDQASDQLINLENMLANIEFKLVEAKFLEGIQNGNKILTKLNKEFVNVDEIMEDAAEQIAYQNEIDETLAQNMVGVDSYEDEIDKELEAMENELVGEMAPEMPTTEGLPAPQLPQKQQEQVAQSQQEEEVTEQPRQEAPLLA